MTFPLQHSELRSAPSQSGAPSSMIEASKSPWTEYSTSLKSASINDQPWPPAPCNLGVEGVARRVWPSHPSAGVLVAQSGGPADAGRSKQEDASPAAPAPRTHASSS